MGDDKPRPALFLVTLTTPGERAKLCSAIDRTTARKQLGFSVTSEIPKYAIPAYKYMGQLATIIRAIVNIPRGDVWPTVLVKHTDDVNFTKADSNMLEHAKSKDVRANRESNKNPKKPATSTATESSA